VVAGRSDAARVELVVQPAFVASRRVAEAAGFVAEDVLRRRMVLHGERIDVVMYSRLPSDGIGTSPSGQRRGVGQRCPIVVSSAPQVG
jgi:hypothetical protein